MATLTGNEIIYVVPIQTNGQPGAILEQTTTGAIASLASNFSNDSPAAVTATTGTTLTAANLLMGLINRSGPTAVYTDTTDTAANIAAALNPPNYPVSFYVDIKNTTDFAQTLAGGTGVTMSAINIIPANSIGEYIFVLTSATAITVSHVFTAAIANPVIEVTTALTTVGAGTITGAAVAGRVTTRSGAQTGTPFTDTTDTAANIILAQANSHIGDSWEYNYQNNTNAVATITGGTGVTVSGITTVLPNMTARYLVTYTAAATVTMVGLSTALAAPIVGTFVNNGVTPVTTANAALTVNSQVLISLKTVGGTVGAIPHLATVTPGTGFTTIGTASDTSTYNYMIIG